MSQKGFDTAVGKLLETVGSCEEFGIQFRRDHEFRPSQGSLIDQQSHDPTFGPYAKEAFNLVVAALVVTEDHMTGIRRLIGPPAATVFTQQVALRAALEAAARGMYLSDPSINARQRAARYLNERVRNITQSLKMARGLNAQDDVDRFQQRLDHLWNVGQALGFRILTNSRGKKEAIEVRTPSATDLLATLFESLNPEIGGLIYRQYSAVAHATFAGLLSSFDIPAEPDAEGVRLGQARVTVLDMIIQTTFACLGWMNAFDRAREVAGWSYERWAPKKNEVLEAVAKVWSFIDTGRTPSG